MSGTTVRISLTAHEKLRTLAGQTGESMQTVLDRALEVYRRQQLLQQANMAFATLRENSTAWKAEQEERSLWETTLGDGLEDA
jgi:predicted transcriptional regulator